ncbi:MAG: TolC family protein [Thermonemataceae bacterium]|nr:TolC family protein [Thermonemataceae bacterium]
MKKIFFVLLLFPFSVSFAQENWSLEKCVSYGVENNISLKQRQLQVESANSTTKQSLENRFAPQVFASATQAYRSGRSIDPFTNQFVTQSVNSTNISLNASLTLFNGFSTPQTISQNKLNEKAAQLDVEQSKRDISLNIANAYLQVLLAQELLEANKLQIESTKSQVERIEKLYKAGAVAETQVLNLKAQLANEEVNIITAENQIAAAKLNLMQQMNMPLSQIISIEKRDVGIISNEYSQQNASQIYEVAEKTQYNLQSADIRTESANKSIQIAKAGLYPTLTLNGGISSAYSSAAPSQLAEGSEKITVPIEIGVLASNPNETVIAYQQIPANYKENGFINQMDFNRSTFVSLNLNIPIYSQGRNKNAITQARIQEKNQNYQAQLLRQQLRQTIEQAYNDMKLAQSNYEARQKQVESLELNFKAVESKFNVGASNYLDYNLAKISLDQAKTNLIRSKYEYVFRIKVLDFYLNKPISL